MSHLFVQQVIWNVTISPNIYLRVFVVHPSKKHYVVIGHHFNQVYNYNQNFSTAWLKKLESACPSPSYNFDLLYFVTWFLVSFSSKFSFSCPPSSTINAWNNLFVLTPNYTMQLDFSFYSRINILVWYKDSSTLRNCQLIIIKYNFRHFPFIRLN